MQDDDDLMKLISRAALGDRKAFSSLYDCTSAKLFGVCLRLMKDRASAEDVLQETYMKIWRNADQYATKPSGSQKCKTEWSSFLAGISKLFDVQNLEV